MRELASSIVEASSGHSDPATCNLDISALTSRLQSVSLEERTRNANTLTSRRVPLAATGSTTYDLQISTLASMLRSTTLGEESTLAGRGPIHGQIVPQPAYTAPSYGISHQVETVPDQVSYLSFCPECRTEGYPLEYAGTDLATVDRPYESVFLGTGVTEIDFVICWLAYPNQDHHETIELVNSDGIFITRNQLARRIAWMYHAYIMSRRWMPEEGNGAAWAFWPSGVIGIEELGVLGIKHVVGNTYYAVMDYHQRHDWNIMNPWACRALRPALEVWEDDYDAPGPIDFEIICKSRYVELPRD